MSGRLWVIFDTCTHSAYYRDVHNLLALPSNAMLRYEYRPQHFSGGALQAAADWNVPERAVLVYAQSKTYQKRAVVPVGAIGFDDMVWVATRLATLRFLRHRLDQDDYQFDLQLGGYPSPVTPELTATMQTLHAAGEVPYFKWIALAPDDALYKSLNAKATDENWRQIVTSLSTAPAQFANDTFWRLQTGQFRTEDEYDQTTKTRVGERAAVRLYEAERLRLPITTYTAAHSTAPDRQLEAQLPADSPVELESESPIALRRHGSCTVDIRAKRSEAADPRRMTLQLVTLPDDNGWPTGPSLTLQLRIGKRLWKVIVGILAIIVGSIVGTGGVVSLIDTGSLLAVLVAIVGALIVTFGGLVLTGKFTFTL